MGGNAIKVEAMPILAYLMAISESQMPTNGPKNEPAKSKQNKKVPGSEWLL